MADQCRADVLPCFPVFPCFEERGGFVRVEVFPFAGGESEFDAGEGVFSGVFFSASESCMDPITDITAAWMLAASFW